MRLWLGLQACNWFQGLGYHSEMIGAQTPYSWLLELVSIRFDKALSRPGDATMRTLADMKTAANHYAAHQVRKQERNQSNFVWLG